MFHEQSAFHVLSVTSCSASKYECQLFPCNHVAAFSGASARRLLTPTWPRWLRPFPSTGTGGTWTEWISSAPYGTRVSVGPAAMSSLCSSCTDSFSDSFGRIWWYLMFSNDVKTLCACGVSGKQSTRVVESIYYFFIFMFCCFFFLLPLCHCRVELVLDFRF